MGLPTISLFSGAGGLDLGVEDAGGTVRAAVELDSACVGTLERNHRFFPEAVVVPRPVEEVSTEELLGKAGLRVGEVALLVGGPPCQPWSKSGYWLQDRRQGAEDPRAAMLDEYLRVLREAEPEGFVFENVPSLTHPTSRATLDSFLVQAESYGYGVATRIVHAVEYGVPQCRVRLFVLGIRGAGSPVFPPPTHWWQRRDDARRRLRPPETAGRWIGAYAGAEWAEQGEVPQGRWLEKLREVPPGWNYKWHTAWAGHPDPAFVTEKKYWSFLLKLSQHRPSWTIQASAGPWTGPLHWDSRRLRIPELAALQTFPKDYRFAGRPAEQRRQIGNAVPCRLAARMVASLLAAIAGRHLRTGRRLMYRLMDWYEFDVNTLRHRTRTW